MWTGLGVNYRGAQANWANDLAYFKSIKNPNAKFPLRILAGTISIPWSAGTSDGNGNFAFRRLCAQTFAADSAFNVIYGLNVGTITTHNWQAAHDAIVAEATYLQAQGIAVEFAVGNEYEGTFGIVFAVSSLTQTAGLATCVTQAAHGFQTGDTITIYGANQSGYNGAFTITVINSTTFTFAVNSGTVTPATGTVNAISMSLATLNANIRQLATDVKAVYSLGKVSYGCFNNTVNGVSAYSDWIANGLGGLDLISIHQYPGVITTGGGYVKPLGPDPASMVAAFGSKCYVSEFGLSGSSTNFAAMPTETAVNGMRTLYASLKSTVGMALVWAFSGDLDADNKFAMRNTDGTFNPVWDILLNDNKRRTFVP